MFKIYKNDRKKNDDNVVDELAQQEICNIIKDKYIVINYFQKKYTHIANERERERERESERELRIIIIKY